VDGTLLDAVVGSAQPGGVGIDYTVAVAGDLDWGGAVACVVVLDVFADGRAVSADLVGQVSTLGGPVGVSKGVAQDVDPIRTYREGVGRYLPAAWGLVLALMAGLATLARAGELAAYRLSGTSARSLGLLLSFEHLAVAGVLAASGAIASVVTSAAFRDPIVPVLSVVVSALVFFVAAQILTVGVTRANPVDLAKDR
jgi:hypothetical protein